MPDIILGGETLYNVPALVVPQDGGGTVQYVYPTSADFMGENVVFLGTKWSETQSFGDIGYYNWTATTTDTTLVASAKETTLTVDLNSYEYWVEEVWESTWDYYPTATKKAIPIQQFGRYYYVIQRRPSNKANIADGTRNTNYVLSVMTGCSAIKYYNTSGNVAVNCVNTSGYSYGIAERAVAPTIDSTSARSTTLNLWSGTINARCSSSYFATARKADVDSSDSKIKRQINVYQVDATTSPSYRQFQRMYDMYNS